MDPGSAEDMINPTLTTREVLPYLQRRQEQFAALTDLLLEENRKFNLTRITDPSQVRLRHYLDSMAALLILEPLAGDRQDFQVIDIGSGAGFPVLPLAIIRTDWRFVSLEATGKKADFQRKACEKLGLENVQVITARAEDLAHQRRYREQFDGALARAVGDLSILAEMMLGFTRPGGCMLAWKGTDACKELTRAQKAFTIMGASAAQSVPYLLEDTQSGESLQMNMVTAIKQRQTPCGLPRSFGQIKKYPL